MIIVQSLFDGYEDAVKAIRFERGLENIYFLLMVDGDKHAAV